MDFSVATAARANAMKSGTAPKFAGTAGHEPKPALAYAWSRELEAEMAPLYARVKHIITPMEWPHYAPLIKSINALKAQRNAVILAHNYMTPEIFHCVGDFMGDSLALAREAARTAPHPAPRAVFAA